MSLSTSIAQLIEVKQVQQKLKTNPDDVASLVKLASMFEKEDQALKRKVIDRILILEPANKAAREMLLELDRAEMFSGTVQAVPADPIVPSPAIPSAPSTKLNLEKPLVSRYSIIHQILVYPAVAIFLLPVILGIPTMEAKVIPGFIIFFLLLMIPVWFVSAVAEVSNDGIKLSRMFGLYRREIEWKDIQSVKPNLMGVGMKLTPAEGRSIPLSSQLHGYARIVEILQGMRPDLFSMDGSKTFKKGFWGKYGWFFILIPVTIMTPGALIVPPFIPGIILVVIVFIFWKSILYAPHTITVSGDRLSAKSFRTRLELTAQQIRDIHIVTVRNRRGVARNMIQIDSIEGVELSFSGFPDGNEIMYGFLRNWWTQYRTV
jgi:hypothetical protein